MPACLVFFFLLLAMRDREGYERLALYVVVVHTLYYESLKAMQSIVQFFHAFYFTLDPKGVQCHLIYLYDHSGLLTSRCS